MVELLLHKMWPSKDYIRDRQQYSSIFSGGSGFIDFTHENLFYTCVTWFIQNMSNVMPSAPSREVKKVVAGQENQLSKREVTQPNRWIVYSTTQLYSINPIHYKPSKLMMSKCIWASQREIANIDDEEQCRQAKRRDISEAPHHRGVREKRGNR